MDPNFDFLHLFATNSDEADSTPLFNDPENQDSPYLASKFSTQFMDTLTFSSNFSNSLDISFLTLNIQSLPSKYNELCELINSLSSNHCSPIAICLQEIWNVTDAHQFPIPGYQPFIFTARPSGQGGGVGIYLKNGTPYKILKDKSVFIAKLYESIFIEISLPSNKKLILGSLYRPNSKYSTLSQSEQFCQFNDILLNTLTSFNPSSQLLLLGDTNIDALKYNISENVTTYIDSLFSTGFLQTSTKPTRCTNHSATLIDHSITNISQNSYMNIILTTKISDHFPVVIFSDKPVDKTTKKTSHTFRNFSTENVQKFHNNLANINWETLLSSNCTESAFNSFHETFTTLHDLHFQPKTVKFNINFHKIEKWMTKGLLISRATKNRLDSIYANKPTEINKLNYINYRNLYNTLIRSCKKLHFSKAIEKNSKNL